MFTDIGPGDTDDAFGKFKTHHTPSTGDMCGVFAITRSLALQLPDFPPVTDREMLRLVRGDDFQGRLAVFDLTLDGNANDDDVENLRPGLTATQRVAATRNLVVDQVALASQMIGEQNGRQLQLGVV